SSSKAEILVWHFLFSLFSKATQNNESFYTKYLCPLFFETLNTERKDPQFGEGYSPHFDCKIPFLNGGLFEECKDKQGKGIETNFILTQSLENTDFKEIFDVFENYNFTIEESTQIIKKSVLTLKCLAKCLKTSLIIINQVGLFTRLEKLCILCVKMS
ncbi:hypothetical protein, partial [Helicobacter japonicus]|uniref:hypothetical protein n=1 Tax=Helicobacter japonicus TaxID=425400 RepID=UPI00259B014C